MQRGAVTADHVLVVEDDFDLRSSLLSAVEELGYEAIDAADGRAALKLLEEATVLPKLVVLDLNMPVMDGASFARAVRSDPRLSDLAIVVLSGDAHVERRIQDVRACAVLRKPVDLHAFRRVVRRQLGRGEGDAPPSKPLVLLVEDDVDVRELTAEYLRDCDFDVTVAEDGAQAVELAKAIAPDVVVMDLGLPIVNGEDAIRRIKADATTRAIPIVVLSGYTQAAHRKIIGELGCAAFIGKPSSPPDLILVIEQALAELRP
jgi:CheY-like chemotaxis protein